MLRRYLISFALLLVTATTLFSQTQFTSYPVGANETPPNGSLGWGVGRFILSADQDTLYYSLAWRIPNLYSASHIHAGAPGVPGGVVHALLNANASGAHGAWAIDPANLANLLAGNLYINVHSNPGFPNGEIRAQILPNPLQAQDQIYTCVMSGANENPPNASTGWGLATLRMNATNDSLYYSFMWRLNNPYSASHFHFGGPGQNGAVQHGLVTANASGAHGVWAIDALNLTRLNHDSLYANAHTNPGFPNGEIRNQVHYSPPPPPIPGYSNSASSFNFSPTYVGSGSNTSFSISNPGTAPLLVLSMTAGTHIWSTTPPAFSVPPGGSQIVNLSFNPSFNHDFEGTLTITTNDPGSPHTYPISGTGCTPVQQPPPPILLSSGSSDAIYFRLPWDLNSEAIEYAVEYSDDDFATSQYVSMTGHGQDLPEWHGMNFWGNESAGAILGLEPNTAYSVRTHARDCIDVELVSLNLVSVTPISREGLDVAELTIYPISPTTIRLRWDPVPVDIDHVPFRPAFFDVFYGTMSSNINTYLGTDDDGSFDVDISANDIGFFKVVPVIEDNGQPHPFIAWPPDGATVRGENTIVVNDFLHFDQWQSAEVYIDNIPLGIDPFASQPENTIPGVFVDYDDYTPGPHQIDIIVTNEIGQTFAPFPPTNINIVSGRPYVGFDATYSPSSQIFNCDTINGENVDGSIVDVLWQNTQGQENYGPTFNFKWQAPDSVVVVKPNLISNIKVLTEASPTEYLYLEEYAAVTPTVTNFKWDVIEITCCCDDIRLNTAGQSEAKYKGEANKRNLGPVVKCTNGNYVVSYAFEVVVVFKYSIVESGGMMCEYGQDCKRTETLSTGGCDENDVFQPLDPPIADKTSHKKHGGTDYPNSGSEFGNDEYGSRPGNHGMNTTVPGQISWYDNPWSHGRLPSDAEGNFAIRTVRHATFLAKAEPQCTPVNIICCREWDLDWDVTFCEDCTITQTVPPTISNEITPAECPELAE